MTHRLNLHRRPADYLVMTVVHEAPAGWYPDPEGMGGQRYWDGQRWTEQRAQATTTVVTTKSSSNGWLAKAALAGVLVLVGIIVVGILAAIAIPVFINKTHQTSQTDYTTAIANQTKSGMQSLPGARQARICALFEHHARSVATKVASTDLRLAATNTPSAYADMLKTMSQAQLLQATTYGVTRGMNEFCAAR